MTFHRSKLFSPLHLTLYLFVVWFFFSPWQPKHHKDHIVQDFKEPSFIFVDTSERTMVSPPSAQAA